MPLVWFLCNVTRSLQPLRNHTARSTKKQTIVLKGNRYKAQWWISNYTVDPHWSLTTHGIALRLCILGMLGKIYHHAKKIVFLQPLWKDWGQYEPHNHWSCVLKEFFYQSFRERLGKAISRAFKICYLLYLFSFLNEFKLPSKTSKIFFKLKKSVSQVQRLSCLSSTSEPQQQK